MLNDAVQSGLGQPLVSCWLAGLVVATPAAHRSGSGHPLTLLLARKPCCGHPRYPQVWVGTAFGVVVGVRALSPPPPLPAGLGRDGL